MNRVLLRLIAVCFLLESCAIAEAQSGPKKTEQQEQPIDFERARELLQKRQRGEPLSSDDKLSYSREDLAGEGTHSSQTGKDKVAGLLLDFLKNDSLAKSWFVR